MAISEQMQGVRDVVRRHADAVRDVEIDDPAIHLDLNTPADVERGLAGADQRRQAGRIGGKLV
jgi:CTP:molybdopterin cytidylyltransferase MocA